MDSKTLQKEYDKYYYLNQVEGWNDFANDKISLRRKECFELLDTKNKNVLDIGFGRGEILQLANENQARLCVGIDYSESAYNIAKEFCGENVVLYNIDIADIDKIKENNFECVYMIDIIEHIGDDELIRFLNKLKYKITHICQLLISTPVNIQRGQYKGMHINQYDEKKLRNILKIIFRNIDIQIKNENYICICDNMEK